MGRTVLLGVTALAFVTGCNSGAGNNSGSAGNASANNSATSNAATANTNVSGAAPAAAAGGPVDRAFVVGHWGRPGDCSDTLSFNEDGSATGGPVKPGSRWTLDGETLSVTEPGSAPEPARVARDGDRLAIVVPDGERLTLTRCAAVGTGGPGQGQPSQ